MRRGVWLVAGVAVVVAAVVVYILATADQQTAVDPGAVVEDFRSDRPSPDGPSPSGTATAPTAGETGAEDGEVELAVACPTDEPAPVDEGVYVYDTEGGEQLGIPTSPSHDYAGQSVQTVLAVPGGYRTTWQPVEERRQESLLCLDGDGGLQLRSSYDARDFFGVTTSRTLVCEPGSVQLPPPGVAAGGGRCSGDGTALEWTTTVVGEEEVVVDGTPVATTHVRMEGELSGNTEGIVENDYWYDRETLLLVRRVSLVDAEGDTPLGVAAYDETARMELTSLVPRR